MPLPTRPARPTRSAHPPRPGRAALPRGCAAATLACALAAGTAPAAAAPQVLALGPGVAPLTLTGRVHGRDTRVYVVTARAGQTLTVQMAVLANAGLAFNVVPEGAREALAIGEHSGLRVQRRLPDDGVYRIEAFLPRSAARRGETGRFRLTVAIDGDALAPLPAAQDARVPGTRYHATTETACRWAYAPAAGHCATGVVRRGRDGTATVDVRGADGQRRRLLFVHGRLEATDAAWPVSSRREGNQTLVEIDGQEQHTVPDALLTGG